MGTKEALEKPRQNHPLSPEYVSLSLHGDPGGEARVAPVVNTMQLKCSDDLPRVAKPGSGRARIEP